MADQANPRLIAVFKTYSRVASTAIIGVSCLVLTGWAVDNEILKRIFPGVVAMNPMTAFNFILAGVAVWLLQSTSPTPASRRVVQVFACFIAAIGLLRIIALLFGWDSGTDQLLFRSKLDLGPPPPNRIAPNTAFNFVLIGLALWLIDTRWRHRAQNMAILVASISLLAVIGYLYGATSFYKVKTYIPMALHTATSFILLATAILCARPNRGLMARIVSDGAGGIMMRRMLIFIIGIPILLGWMLVAAQHNRIYDESFRLAIYVVLIVIVFCAMVRANAISLDRHEQERDQAQQALEQSEQQYRSLAEAMPQIVWTAQPDGALDYYNQRWFDYTGMTLEQTRGWGWGPVLHPDDLQLCVERWVEAVQTGGDYQIEYRFKRASDATYRWHLGRAVPLRDANGQILKWFGTCTDIDDQRRAQEETTRAKEAAEAATMAKSEFLANMSHELRTPLNAIIGFSEVLEDETFGALNPRQSRYVTNILTSGRHLLQLINDILDIAKIEAGRLTLDRAPFPVGVALNDVAAIVKALANKKSINLTVEAADELPLLTADQPKFKQIMYNLISNAIKFTPEGGGVTVTASLDTPGRQNGSTCALRIAVCDTGIGIKADDQERVFGQFEQVDSSYSRQQQGTGLGLALTRNLIELHGGRIWVESEGIEGRGSTFTFVLPLEIAEIEMEPSTASEQAALDSTIALSAAVDTHAPVVLVVEDNGPASELLAHYLNSGGYAVAHAEDGDQAIQMVKELHPYAVTLDIMLPEKDGWQVLAELKAEPETADVPVVIVSMTEDRHLGVSLGALDFLVKPVDKDRLLETIAKAGALSGKPVLTILVVDDEPATVEFLSDLLRHRGYAVLPAHGGRQGIELALEKLPDVIILDLMMPEVTGFDVVHRLQENEATRDIPIIIFSAKDITEEDRWRLNSGIASIVSKSGKEDLLHELEKLRAVHRPG